MLTIRVAGRTVGRADEKQCSADLACQERGPSRSHAHASQANGGCENGRNDRAPAGARCGRGANTDVVLAGRAGSHDDVALRAGVDGAARLSRVQPVADRDSSPPTRVIRPVVSRFARALSLCKKDRKSWRADASAGRSCRDAATRQRKSGCKVFLKLSKNGTFIPSPTISPSRS